MDYIKKQKALGLVEALVALAVVGTGMVIITQISLKTIKKAKENEMQDVAVQAAVEAMDFMKSPGVIDADVIPSIGTPRFYKLDITIPGIVSTGYSQSELMDAPCDCDSGSSYLVSDLYSSGYTMCQQIKVTAQSDTKSDLEVIVVWQTFGGNCEKRVFKGYRLGGFE